MCVHCCTEIYFVNGCCLCHPKVSVLISCCERLNNTVCACWVVDDGVGAPKMDCSCKVGRAWLPGNDCTCGVGRVWARGSKCPGHYLSLSCWARRVSPTGGLSRASMRMFQVGRGLVHLNQTVSISSIGRFTHWEFFPSNASESFDRNL